jgi:hypothetical protein
MKKVYKEDRFEIYALSDIKKEDELTNLYQSLKWRKFFNELNSNTLKSVTLHNSYYTILLQRGQVSLCSSHLFKHLLWNL